MRTETNSGQGSPRPQEPLHEGLLCEPGAVLDDSGVRQVALQWLIFYRGRQNGVICIAFRIPVQ